MKKKLAATFLAGAISATAASSLLTRTTPQGTVLRVVNVETVFNYGTDGGITGKFRACGHEDRVTDGGRVRVAEPCWAGELPAEVAGHVAAGVLPLYKVP